MTTPSVNDQQLESASARGKLSVLGLSALTYAERFRFHVFPVVKGGKTPLTQHGYKDASRDPAVIGQRWGRCADANVGIETGAHNGIVVLDVDDRHDGHNTLAELERKHGALPQTPVVLTGGGGQHFYFSHPGIFIKTCSGIAPGLDVRGDGGYVVAPPSMHASGKRYMWEVSARLDEVKLARLPDWLLALMRGGRGEKQARAPEEWQTLVTHDILEGGRRDRLRSFTGHLLGKNVDAHVTMELILALNRQRCKPPLPEAEVVLMVDGIAGRDLARRMGKAQHA